MARHVGPCLGVVRCGHGVGAVEVQQVCNAAQHGLLGARAAAAAEVVQPTTCMGAMHDLIA